MPHELFEELSMFCPSWQRRFAHVKDAAVAANAMDLYYAWARTADGIAYGEMIKATFDTFKQQNALLLSQRAIEDMAVAMDLHTFNDAEDI